jgi:hypothetical protein
MKEKYTHSDLKWTENDNRHVLEVWKNNQLILRFTGRVTYPQIDTVFSVEIVLANQRQ